MYSEMNCFLDSKDTDILNVRLQEGTFEKHGSVLFKHQNIGRSRLAPDSFIFCRMPQVRILNHTPRLPGGRMGNSQSLESV